MRYYLLAVILLAAPLGGHCETTPVAVSTTAPVAVTVPARVPMRKIQKVMIVNLAWDTARAAEVEAGIKANLMKKGVTAASLRTFMVGHPPVTNVKDLSADIESQGYDSLLCVGAYKTMRITPADQQNDFPSMDSCLSIYLTNTYPSGVSLRSEPFIVQAQPTVRPSTTSGLDGSRTPIPTTSAAAPVVYYKRMIRLFDVPKHALFWEKRIMLKMPSELRESGQTSWIADETAKTLDQSGLLK